MVRNRIFFFALFLTLFAPGIEATTPAPKVTLEDATIILGIGDVHK